MKEKILKSTIEDLVSSLQQRVDLLTVTDVSWFEQETNQNYDKLETLQRKMKKDEEITNWVHAKEECSDILNKLENQVEELESMAEEWERYLELLTDTKLRKYNV